MAGSCENSVKKRLCVLFEEAFDLYEKICNSSLSYSHPELQNDIANAIEILENVTNMVSQLGVFSINETLDEVATSNLKYFLLPALLGCLTLRKILPDRMEVVEVAKIYFKDFLRRCYDYGIIEKDVEEEIEEDDIPRASAVSNLRTLTYKREEKIKRYKEQKIVNDKIKIMEELLKKPNIDEEIKRKYYISLLDKYKYTAQEELECIELEIPLLLHMVEIKDKPQVAEAASQKRLQPVIITRNELQKKVFGLGYPSLPTMTVEEFAERQIKNGIFPSPDSLQTQSVENRAASELAEVVRKERLEEIDDSEMLARTRAMDEFKDEHRRGEGNRANRS